MKYLIDEATVFAIGYNYDIIFNTTEKGLAWVEIGNKRYCDSDNGNIKSEECVHKITIPMKILDQAKGYKICFKRAIERKQYFPTSEEEVHTKEYSFRPVEKKENYNIYMIADTHSKWELPSQSAQYFGDGLDFLIMNGDIADGSIDLEHILVTHKLASEITKGELPVVFVRGNHDTRGAMAVELSKYIPTQNSNTYFTFALGDVFGICLDCGEDKSDDHAEYGCMADFEEFRRKETEFLDKVLEEEDYLNYSNVLLITHIRPNIAGNEFDKNVYAQWIDKINEIAPDVMLCGHEHKFYVLKAGNPVFDTNKKICCPIVVGAQRRGKDSERPEMEDDFIATALTITPESIEINFTNKNKEVVDKHLIGRN